MPFYRALKSYQQSPTQGVFPEYPGKQGWIASRLLTLRQDLDAEITAGRRPRSLIIGSWNIRAFDDGAPRLDESYHYIAEIIAAFDMCAVQEIKSDLAPLERLCRLLGPNWEYFVSDVSTHRGGNNERMAFLYNTNRVVFRRLIGELVVDPEDLEHSDQLARSPFFAAFQADWFRFCLCSSHIVFGGSSKTDKAKRADEIRAITKMLVSRAKREDQVYIFLGDMNIEAPDGPIMKALRDSKMVAPGFPATNMLGDKFYDQMAFSDQGAATRKTRLLRHGVFDWRRAVFGPYPADELAELPPDALKGPTRRIPHAEMLAHYEPICAAQRKAVNKAPYADFARSYGLWTSFEMSDHLPIWIEIEIDYSDAYLSRFL